VNKKASDNSLAVAKAALLFLAAFSLYFGLRSPVLDDHDSVQFAMGVLHFNVWNDPPHAPGYPLFIFPGWIAHEFFGIGPNFSLHFVSAFGGALFIAVWFLWMTATKVLTCAVIAASLSGAIACGARPQWMALTLPALLRYIIIPAAIDNHRNPPPAMRLVHYLGKLYPRAKRKDVALFFKTWNDTRSGTRRAFGPSARFRPRKDCRRFFPAPRPFTPTMPNFDSLQAGISLPSPFLSARALIHWRHHFLELYLVERHGAGQTDH
jgi:hypothetical protein